MEIWHRLTFSNTSNIEQKLVEFGIAFKKTPTIGRSYLIHIDISESNPAWVDMVGLAKSLNALDVFNTTFSQEEISATDWVRVCPAFEKGYPEPYSNMGWLKSTLSGRCEKCGTGYTQIAPYQTQREPKIGKNNFVSLIATYTLFCTAHVVQNLENIGVKGLDFLPLHIRSLNKSSENIFQWQVPGVAGPGLLDDTEVEKCEECGTTKHQPHLRGFMLLKKDSISRDADVLLSHEWFGSGHAAYREFFISQNLAKIFLREKWRGISLKPVRLI